jgi:hypothetical protein
VAMLDCVVYRLDQRPLGFDPVRVEPVVFGDEVAEHLRGLHVLEADRDDRQPAAVGGRHLAGDMLGAVGSGGEHQHHRRAAEIPSRIATGHFWPGPMSRGAIQHGTDAASSAATTRRAVPASSAAWQTEDAARILGGYALPDTAAMVRTGQSEVPVLTRPGSPRRDSGMSAITLWENPPPLLM